MKVLVRKNPRVVALEGDTQCLTFRQHKSQTSNKNSTRASPQVVVQLDLKDSITREKRFVPLVNRSIYGFLGLITVGDAIYIAVITGAVTEVAQPVPYESVNRIFAVEFLSISNSDWDFVSLDGNGFPIASGSDLDDYDSNSGTRVPHPCWELRKLLLNGSFYFSNDFDLTSLLQNRGVNSSKLKAPQTDDRAEINVNHYQEQFMWNSFLMEEMLRFRSQLDEFSARALERNRFLTTVIRGFAKTTPLGGGNSISIVSKQSWKRAGTRFHSRGIDDNGDVANFVESEFIFYNPSKGLVYSFTQVRGSVPAFWEQDLTLINPKITVTRSIDATQSSFDAHFTEICAKYNACHIVNLLSKTKLMEVELLRRYLELLRRSTHSDDLLYTHFDFHAETKQLSGGFAGASKLLPFLHKSLEQFGWFNYDLAMGEVIKRQDGVLRVNCLDCLDRTNLIEQVVCQSVVEYIMRNQGVSLLNSPRDRARLEEMTNRHNDLWADNGDAISQIYTGTNALKSSFSRSGKMNLAGALSDVTKSVSRMYQNTFNDSKKQTIIDLLLGKDRKFSIAVQIFDPSSDHITEQLRRTESSFTSYNEITVFTGTFNVNAALPQSAGDLSAWLFPPENNNSESPDIYAIGLQELIELNAGSFLGGDTAKPLLWAEVLQKQLNARQEQYVLLRTELMSSMCLFLFVRKSKISSVTQVAGASKKTGLGGIAANKGACAVRFDYGLTSFALVTSHLAAGLGALVERHNDYVTIMAGLSFTRNLAISDHDHILWFGDLNYRINAANDLCRAMINRGAFDELQNLDQLVLELRERGGAFYGLIESRILFMPTYKFDRGTSQYDSSEKQRVPSWTDRVLYRSKTRADILSLNYNSVSKICISDHKPVYSTLKCKVKFVNEVKKAQLSAEFYNAYKAEHGDSGDDARSSSLADSASSVSQELGFASDTLSQPNLVDVDLGPPKPPPRSRTIKPPRKLPPLPANYRAPTVEFTISNNNNEDHIGQSALVPESSVQPDTATPPSPARKAAQVPELGISSAPLTPKSYSPAPSSKSSTVDLTQTSQETTVVRPMKPAKPRVLSASKTEIPALVASSCGALSAPVKGFSQDYARALENSNKPPPPPSRVANTPLSNGNMMTMSEWKPLVPK